MVLEVAILDVKPDRTIEFENAFREAQAIISAIPGYLDHQLQHCIEDSNRSVLLVNWRTLKDHTVGFRGSPDYQRCKALLHDFYDPFAQVQHYESVPGVPDIG
jgi:heme-degrading monooxygenase HmoA